MRRILYWLADCVNENRRLRARVQFLLEANNEAVEARRQAKIDAMAYESLWRREMEDGAKYRYRPPLTSFLSINATRQDLP